MAGRKKNQLPNRVYSGLTSSIRLGDTTMICPICGRQIHLGRINVELQMDLADGAPRGYPHHLVGRTIQPGAIIPDTTLMYRQGNPTAYDYLGQHLIEITCRDDGMGNSHISVPMIGVPSVLAPMIDQLHAHKIWVMGTELVENDSMFARMAFVELMSKDTINRIADIQTDDGTPMFGKIAWYEAHDISILNTDVINYTQGYYQLRTALCEAVESLINVLQADETFMKANMEHENWLEALLHSMYESTPNVVTGKTGFYPSITTDSDRIGAL